MNTSEFIYRLFSLKNDLDALTNLYHVFDEGATGTTIQDEIQDWDQAPGKDRWIVEDPENMGQFIAHAWIARQTKERVYTHIAVRPKWRRKGIGSRLLTYLKDRAREMEAINLMGGGSIDETEALAFLKHHGFEPMGSNRTFIAPEDVAIPDPVWPENYTVRTYAETQDLSQLVTVQNLSYHDMWGHWENTPGAVTKETLGEAMQKFPDSFIPTGIFIAFDPDDRLAGLCYGRIRKQSDGYRKIVDSPGVVPEYRHLQLQRPLTLVTMRWLRDNYGAGPIELETYGEHDAALPIYDELGFTLEPSNHWVEHRLRLA
ncbi:MAG: GNAT family N-acetyltransferase [Chloroflexota bacterium]